MELNMCKLAVTSTHNSDQQLSQPPAEQIKIEESNNDVNTHDSKDAPPTSLCGGGKTVRAEKKHEEKLKTEQAPELIQTTELLGSVTTQNCPGTRTSARVIQKMKQDLTRPLTPPPSEREHNKKDEKNAQKTPSQVRPHRTIWTNLERNYFFDALNEFGKDFEAVSNCINSKLKRRGTNDFPFKTKEQVRLHYYQTYHKICKYIRYSDEIKKPAQELYTLINYGEMRRKLQFLSEKHFMKLRQLIYQGYVTIRVKGKNIRIKTPSCKALRRLNQLDDALEDIRLPTKIEVIVTPANMEAFGRVQTLAQNPRARATVPLHKKLVNFIKTFQYKWRSQNAKLAEEELKLFPPAVETTSTEPTTTTQYYQDTEICFRPKSGVQIHRPLLSITEYLSSVNICLTAYEERMGVKVRSETISYERNANNVNANKRQRTESGSEKRSPESKKLKQLQSPVHDKSLDEQLFKEELVTTSEADIAATLVQSKVESSSGDDELNDELHEMLGDPALRENSMTETANKSDTNNVADNSAILCNTAVLPVVGTPTTPSVRNKRNTGGTPAAATNISSVGGGSIGSNHHNSKFNSRNSLNFIPLLNDDSIKSIRKGWTISKAKDITVGDLYVALGQDSKLELEYYWREETSSSSSSMSMRTNTTANLIPDALDTEPLNYDLSYIFNSINGGTVNTGSSTLLSKQHLPDIMTEENNLRLKSLKTSTISNKLKHLLMIANLSERVRKRQCFCGHICDRNTTKTRIDRDLAKCFVSNIVAGGSEAIGTCVPTDAGIFRQPTAPVPRPIISIDPVKQSLSRQKFSRHMMVQRRVIVPGRKQPNYDLVGLRNLQNNYIDCKKLNDDLNTVLMTNGNPQMNVSPTTTTTTNTVSNDHNNLTTKVNSNEPLSTIDFDMKSNNIKSSNIPAPTTSASSMHDTRATSSDYFGTTTTPLLSATAENCTTTTNNNNIKIENVSSSSNSNNNSSYDINNCTRNSSMPILDIVEEALLNTAMPESAYDESTSNFFNGMSPMHLLRDSTSNSRWLEENLNDFSLTSLLGQLDEINASRDILDPSSSMSVISESSVDYRHKFQEISALMQSQEKD